MNSFLTSALVKQWALSLARHALTSAGGALVTQGLLMDNQMNDFLGSGLFLVGLVWSWWEKHNKKGA